MRTKTRKILALDPLRGIPGPGCHAHAGPGVNIPATVLDADARLSLYLATRHLAELQAALQVGGLPARYERPGAGGIAWPRLHVRHPLRESPGAAIRVTPWLEWAHDRALICPAADLSHAAALFTEQLPDRT